jgi:penicillin-insensitive murein endopeptidase
VDLSYYYTTDDPWYTRAHAKNLDRARTWALVKAFITETDVQYIFINHSIQRLLREHALSIGENPHWLDQIFGGKTATLRPIIRHARGHATHIHVRFYNPIAQETGRRLYPLLIKHKTIRPPTYYIRHRVRKGQTLSHLARRYNTSTRAIRRANRLRSNMIRAGRVYKIPRSGGVPRGMDEPVTIPPRRLPPVEVAAPDAESPDHEQAPDNEQPSDESQS